MMVKIVAAVNDLPFYHRFESRMHADRALHVFLRLYQELKQNKYRAIERFYGVKIDVFREIAPGLKLIQVLQNFKTKDEQRLLLTILNNLDCPDYQGPLFYLVEEESKICAFARGGILLSLDSASVFSQRLITGELDGRVCEIKNIASILHIRDYDAFLGHLLYERSPKHREREYIRSGETVSPMDLNDEEAQLLLDRAIRIGERYYAKIDDRYYVFPVTVGNRYHGFRDDRLQQNIRDKIDTEFNQTQRVLLPSTMKEESLWQSECKKYH